MTVTIAFYFLLGHMAAKAFDEWQEDGGLFYAMVVGIALLLVIAETSWQ